MPIKDKKQTINRFLEMLFTKDDSISFYFLKKSRVSDEYEYMIPFKTRKKLPTERVREIEQGLQNKIRNKKLKLVRWSDIIGKIIPQSKVYKLPFFDSKKIETKNPWRVCPDGKHWVRRHQKNLRTGKVTDHDGHCRVNPTGKDLLKGDEIDQIIHHELFRNPKVKVTSSNLGFGSKGSKYDDLISGWTAYWNNIFKLKDPLHPNYVKILMATESGFKSESKAPNSKAIGYARGLLQITEQTQRWLKGSQKELRSHFVVLDDKEIWEPNKNIAAGIRWLFRKREIAKSSLKREPTWEEVLLDYKGVLKSKTDYAKKEREKLKKKLDLIKNW